MFRYTLKSRDIAYFCISFRLSNAFVLPLIKDI